MKRRSLLALLGLGSVGGAAVVLSDDKRPRRSLGSASDTLNDSDGTAGWGRQLQSELGDRSRYGAVSFAKTAATVDVENDDFLSSVAIEPAATGGDLFRFQVDDQASLRETVALVEGTLRVAEEVSFTATLGDTSIEFTGGASAIGEFAAARGTHPDTPEVIVVRATSTDRLTEVLDSVDS